MPEGIKRPQPIVIEGARLLFKNFSGEERMYNPAGQRNFTLVVPEDLAPQLEEEGWKIKWREGRHPEDPAEAYLAVTVKFKSHPEARGVDPLCFLIQGRRKMALDAQSVGVLDRVAPLNVDLVIRPYVWEVNGTRGVKAYLEEIYYTAVEGLSSKYADYEEV